MTRAMPTGTVTLLFSDIEGSTALLSRLGSVPYAEVLSAQREVLRAAWAAHGGTEMGTEGDSFFVAFETAPAAVAAAVQAQHGLAARVWPAGVSVRVRMGIHTGTPGVHDGGYVGMDVHRAARIAGAAHGGQVVVSAVTAGLVGAGLPPEIELRELGSFRLKDLPAPERLYQLSGAGLLDGFPALKTLGSASSLPRPATELVGRDGELAELTALLGSAHVRLVTLTGPGGSGKTRLAIGVGASLIDQYPGGVFFVQLAAVTTSEVMWTTIAEVLDVPPEGRTPPALFAHIAEKRALFVLDNLEQLSGADNVVAELLREAPHAVVVATTRRPLHLAAEHEHQVPPLEVAAEHADLAAAEASGAVQLFVQQARRVKASFALTADNVADVVSLCRKLDGLPLAIELAAARTKLLTPRAILSRLDDALDLRGPSADRPTRQQNLRATIGWSYDLLDATQQQFFRRLGIFVGGADLEAVTSITASITADVDVSRDVFDVVTELVDASLVTISDDSDGEPRVALLETIRAYANGQLTAHRELDDVSRIHSEHYLKSSEQWVSLMFTDQRKAIFTRFETEHDNLRAALAWALGGPTPLAVESHADDDHRIRVGLGLCANTCDFWWSSRYSTEAVRWLEDAILRSGGRRWAERADCLTWIAVFLHGKGERDRAVVFAQEGVDLLRELRDYGRLPWSIAIRATIEWELGNPDVASGLFEEAVTLAEDTADGGLASQLQYVRVLGESSVFAHSQGNYERALELERRVIEVSDELGHVTLGLTTQQNMACTLRLMGRCADARLLMVQIVPQFLEFNEVANLTDLADDYAAILAELGEARLAVQLVAASEVTREDIDEPRRPSQQAEISAPLAKARRSLTATEWDEAWAYGRMTPIEKVLKDACAPRPTDPPG